MPLKIFSVRFIPNTVGSSPKLLKISARFRVRIKIFQYHHRHTRYTDSISFIKIITTKLAHQASDIVKTSLFFVSTIRPLFDMCCHQKLFWELSSTDCTISFGSLIQKNFSQTRLFEPCLSLSSFF